MIAINQLRKQLDRRIEKLPKDGCIEVLTYKRNRGFIIWKEGDDSFLVREHGYHEEVWEDLDWKAFEKLLPRLCKREFPRSNKVRLYTHDPGDILLIQDQISIRI